MFRARVADDGENEGEMGRYPGEEVRSPSPCGGGGVCRDWRPGFAGSWYSAQLVAASPPWAEHEPQRLRGTGNTAFEAKSSSRRTRDSRGPDAAVLALAWRSSARCYARGRRHLPPFVIRPEAPPVSTHRVLVTDTLSPAGMALLDAAEGIELVDRQGMPLEGIREALRDVDAILIRSRTKLTPEILAGQQRLKLIVRAGVGVDNIDQPAATREGIVVMNTPAGNTVSTAEHAVAMMMALSRNIAPAAASIREGRWDRKSYTGTQLAGKTLAVVGLGRIGLTVARMAQGLDMRIVGYDPFLSAERAEELGIELFRDVDEIAKRCDFLTVHTPLTDETRGMIDARRLSLMKRGVRLVNCARGGIIDEEALADAIESGHVAGAALDVFTEEPPPAGFRLTRLDNVLGTPHLGASTDEAQELVAVEAAELAIGFLVRNEVRHAINMVPVSGTELKEVRMYLDLARRLGLLLCQLVKSSGIKGARINYRGDVASKPTKLITASFTAGLLEGAMDEGVNIVSAEMMARDRGIEITETTSSEPGDFATLISVTLETDTGEQTAAGTLFGKQFVRLVRLGPYPLEAYLDGNLIIYRHRDVPGLIGFIGTVCGKHGVNIAGMSLGRSSLQKGGDSVAVLNVDEEPSAAALAEIAGHAEVTGVDLVKLPTAGAVLPWLGS
jgi:D-3-phosphoglycerate dehydrogenase / 2-oxoglutarate reductase